MGKAVMIDDCKRQPAASTDVLAACILILSDVLCSCCYKTMTLTIVLAPVVHVRHMMLFCQPLAMLQAIVAASWMPVFHMAQVLVLQSVHNPSLDQAWSMLLHELVLHPCCCRHHAHHIPCHHSLYHMQRRYSQNHMHHARILVHHRQPHHTLSQGGTPPCVCRTHCSKLRCTSKRCAALWKCCIW